uniref:Colicin import membrane protein n=1 Tax=Candidatus Kentrum sp. TC TaxID=2126339 RepID=A0A450YJI5_9GAMM|nr:MAG: colicin import membrane protein [Candidatus Kentron sp. TC]VFK41691.1 MAG: colicin import membrane protein [Candidatus Kentron sp. TC]
MFRLFLDKVSALFLAVVVHVVFVVVLLVNLDWSSKPTPTNSMPHARKVEPIQAVVVDEAKIQAELTKIEEHEQMVRQAEEERLRKLEEKTKAIERRRKEEERRLAIAKKKRKDEQERQRKQVKEEKARKEAARRREEEERKRKAKEKKEAAKKEALRKKKEAERKRKEAERTLQRKLAAEQAKREQRLRDRYRMAYVVDIKSTVKRNWIRIVGATKGLKCKLKVAQIPTGEVIEVSVIESSGNAAFDRSAVAAVFKSSPLPLPKDPSVFDRNIVLTFNPED